VIVTVCHDNQPVARFTFDTAESINDALELAWRHTNNVMDSWSRPGGQDAHPSLELLQPLCIHEGREYGHRSSMIGDIFEVTDIEGSDHVQSYSVAMCGFERIAQ
jgi:hypothetical protein